MQRAQHEYRRGDKAALASAKARSCPVMLAAGAWEEEEGKGSLELIVEGPECHSQAQGEFYKQKGESLIIHVCTVLHKL